MEVLTSVVSDSVRTLFFSKLRAKVFQNGSRSTSDSLSHELSLLLLVRRITEVGLTPELRAFAAELT
jgi:hypothetical protein